MVSEEKGQGLVEYALILVLIVIVVMVAMKLFGVSLFDFYTTAVNALDSL